MRYRILSCFLLLSCCPIVAADGLIRDGLGARVAGRGGTNLAWSDSGTILHDNVGGAVNFKGCELVECTIDAIFTEVDYRDPDGVSDFQQDLVPLGNLTILRKANPNVAYGLGVYSTGGFATKYAAQGPAPFTGERTYKSFGALARILPGISLKLTDKWSTGATLGVAASHVELEGPYTLQTGALANTPTLLDLQATGAALTWSIGSQYQLNSKTTLGVAYQSEARFNIDGKTTTIVPGLGESVFDTELDMVWPRSLGLGVRHEFCEHKVGSIDVIYYNWQNAFDDVGIFLTNPTNLAFAGLGPIEEQTPLRWRDTLSVRVGYEQMLQTGDKVRCGYVWHRNPIPAETLTPWIVPIIEHTVSVGYGSCFEKWEVDFGYQYMFGNSVSVGTSDFVGGDFDGSEVDTQLHLLYVSFLRR